MSFWRGCTYTIAMGRVDCGKQRIRREEEDQGRGVDSGRLLEMVCHPEIYQPIAEHAPRSNPATTE